MTTTSELPPPTTTGIAMQAVHTAERLVELSERLGSESSRRQTARIARLLEDPAGVAFVTSLSDEVLRIRDPKRAARRLRDVCRSATPGFLGPVDRVALSAGSHLAGLAPRVVMALVTARVRSELSGFVHDAEPRSLSRHISKRREQGFSTNVNLLGEAVLGDEEASHRLESVAELLSRPEVDYVSVKVSSICAQINPVAFDYDVERVAGRLRLLYRTAQRYQPAKFVNLDMEEFRDLALTLAAFKTVLDEEEFHDLRAGIVLQAYLPDSFGALRDLTSWARARRETGKGRIKVRLVKGANLAMERVTAELAGWPQAPFTSKAEVDASYKRLLSFALDPKNSDALRIGVASHNLFDVSWAMSLAKDRGVAEMLEMEMLEGMAPSIAEAVRSQATSLLLYAPVARRSDHESVVAYLVRRFDENTGPENFLRHQFSLSPGSRQWNDQRDRFLAALADSTLEVAPTRMTQDRAAEEQAGVCEPPQAVFANEPDTDFSLAGNRAWIVGHLGDASVLSTEEPIPAVIDSVTVDATDPEVAVADGYDPAIPDIPAYKWVQISPTLMRRAVRASRRAAEKWRSVPPAQRRMILLHVAEHLAARRGALIAVMARDAGKVAAEADTEVSEAIDFARYYASCMNRIDTIEADGASFRPYRCVAVIPPWNFPLAIPASGVLACLAAGSAVLLKPAPETVATAWALAGACWDAGVPRDVLQFVPCADGDSGRALVSDPDVDAVVLTGSWDTARMFLGWRPSLALHAETSGKNAIVVTATADLDGAVADLVRSAFGHAGQKCSAASLAILEAGVYDDKRFLRQLADAARSLVTGPGWDPRTTMGPLIRAPQGPLADALGTLGPGESWLVEPKQVKGNPNLYTPGVKMGVRPGSAFHVTECFGPVLGLMRAVDLEEAIFLQNATGFGLTAGLHALDPKEIDLWKDKVEAGNLYVNRHITGAVVRRQPFGGWKRSSIGPGAKSGGPNYVSSLGSWHTPEHETAPEAFGVAVGRAIRADLAPSDPSGLLAESNVLRYRPIPHVVLRAGDHTPPRSLALAVAAATAAGVRLELSLPEPSPAAPGATVEDEASLAERLASGSCDKLRVLGEVTDDLRLAALDAGVWLDCVPVAEHPTLEALRWVREQSVSQTMHRHGNLQQTPAPLR